MNRSGSILRNSVFQTFAAMIIGAGCGLIFGTSMSSFKFIGDIWLNCLKMILVPLVFCTMTLAVGGQSSLKTLGRVALRIFFILHDYNSGSVSYRIFHSSDI